MISSRTGNNLNKANAPTILVTRPEPGASVTAEKLKAAGFNVVIQPFTQMVAKPVVADHARFRGVTAIIVTSANALRYLSSDIAAELFGLRVFTVGDATQQEALRQGFKNVRSADGDAQNLINLLRRELTATDRVVYLCGAIRTPDIEEELDRLKLDFTVLETYHTEKISQLTDKLNALFLETNIDAICFYSSVSAQLFAGYVEAAVDQSKLLNIKYYCISERAKLSLPEPFRGRAYICEKPKDDAMIDLLVKHYNA